MAQNSVRSCPNCYTPLGPGQRFCSNCGAIVEVNANKPTELTPNSAGSIANMATRMPVPPPPPPDSGFQAPFPPSQDYQPPAQSYQPPPIGYQPPAYTRPQKDSSGKVLGQIGCGMLAIILLVLALCSTAGFFVYRAVSSAANSVQATVSTASGSSSSSTDVTPTFAPPTVSPVNATVKYADVDITIVDVKQAANFPDENNTSSPGIVRVDLSENNTTSRGSSYYYGDMVRLLLPDGTSVVPLSTQAISGPDASVSRKNWIDFAVAPNIDVKKLTLRLGKPDESQIDVPLTSNPDVSKYLPKTVTPNKSVQYSGTTWTIVSATKQSSGDNRQAPQGQAYVIVKLRIDNNSARDFNAYPGDYVRLQSGATKASPESYTIPLGVSAGQTNQTGQCLFLLPQSSTDFTLLLLANSSGTVQSVSIPFQIQ